MNIVFHALLGLLLTKLFGISSVPDIAFCVLFSVFPDFDHITHFKKALKTGRFGVESRSPLHELTGLVLVLLGSFLINLIYPQLSLSIFICGGSHFIVDLLTRPTRPLYPFAVNRVDLHFYPRGLKEMFILDAILTVALGLIYFLSESI